MRFRPSRRLAFTLIEILVCLGILSACLLPLYFATSVANRGSMDTYYEFLAEALAQEPIEVFRAIGYRALVDYTKQPLPDYPLGWQDLAAQDWQKMPAEAGVFRRLIEIVPATRDSDDPPALLVRVTVAPTGSTWLTRSQIVAETLIVEDTP